MKSSMSGCSSALDFRHGAVMFHPSKPCEAQESGMSGTCHAQLFMMRSIATVHQQQPPVPAGNPNGILAQSPWLHRRGATMGEWCTTKQPWMGCAVVKPGEVGGRCLNGAERAQRPIDLHYHATAFAGQGTCSIPRHNHLRGCGALPTHTRGNAADGATPGFGAEPLQGSRKGNHCPKVSTIEPSTISGTVTFCASKPWETHESGMSGTCHAQLFMTRCIGFP